MALRFEQTADWFVKPRTIGSEICFGNRQSEGSRRDPFLVKDDNKYTGVLDLFNKHGVSVYRVVLTAQR